DGFRARAARESAAVLCRAVVEESGLLAALRADCRDEAAFARRRSNLDELAQWLDGSGARAGDLVAQLALLGHADRDEPGNAVRLMSLHAAKGLEFRFVCIIGVEDGNLPHAASIEEGRLEEERRLLYVGITRAKQWLQLSWCKRARRFGELVRNAPSPFLDELPPAELYRVGEDERPPEEAKERADVHLARMAALLAD